MIEIKNLTTDASHEAPHADEALETITQWFMARPHFAETVAQALRRALDEVIDCQRTGRFSVEQLEKTEKTCIGTQVEIVLRSCWTWNAATSWTTW